MPVFVMRDCLTASPTPSADRGTAADDREKKQRTMKIIGKIQQAMEAKEPFYSFEFFPPKTSAGVENL